MDKMVTYIKIWRKLQGIIVQYLHEKDSWNFAASLSWDEIVDIIRGMGTTAELMKLRQATREKNLTYFLKRNEKGKASLALALCLDNLYSIQFGGVQRSRTKPY